ncbi:(2Fe-2S)-binding protein [Ferrimonas balearica]|uniref:(2Fe-2S)-binding protein n=1 Tax=Ferrimonas balearica TaxID=44012 RepID=UPI001C9982C4|nr:(2Fe-2S)-binding protein [Ferrimonas balearica]MBY5993189.1 (2Fe-2S)-binding protein [Ferrimonas balearica]
MKLNINGTEHTVDAAEDIPLLWLLRDHLSLTGTKYGCGMAQCGACTVMVDGRAVRACTTKAKSVQGKAITTIEGNHDKLGATVIAVWNEMNVHQCGYCQSGQVMTATALLRRNPEPDDAAIDRAMSVCICRCGTYQRVRQAIKRASDQLKRQA